MHDDNPYSAPQAPLAEPELREHVLADRGLRLAGAIIDTVIMVAIVLPIMFVGGYFAGMMEGRQPSMAAQLGWGLGSIAVFMLVQGWPLVRSGQTWGKKLLRMRIVDLDGHQPPVGRLIGLRYVLVQLLGLVPFVGMFFSLVDVLFIFGDERRCLHDLIAGTRVVMVE